MALGTNDLTEFITYATAAAGFLCLVVGLIIMLVEVFKEKSEAKEAVKNLSAAANTLTEQGAVGGALESTAKFAAALKDLDAGTRVLTISIAFFAVAAVAAGTDAIASAVAS